MEIESKEWPAELLLLFEDQLLDGVKPKPKPVTADDRVQGKIDKLRAWIDANGREPQETGPINERILAKSLQTLKNDGLWT